MPVPRNSSQPKWGKPRSFSSASARRAQAGVTLIEMLVVAMIISLFASFVIPSLFGHVDRDRVIAARVQITGFLTGLGAYKLDTGSYPSASEGLDALRFKPASANAKNWRGPYLPKEVPLDPWGHPYVYTFPGPVHPDEPGITSLGADGQPGGEGSNSDIVSWKDR